MRLWWTTLTASITVEQHKCLFASLNSPVGTLAQADLLFGIMFFPFFGFCFVYMAHPSDVSVSNHYLGLLLVITVSRISGLL